MILLIILAVAGIAALAWMLWPKKADASEPDAQDDIPASPIAKKKKALGIDAPGTQRQPVPALQEPYASWNDGGTGTDVPKMDTGGANPIGSYLSNTVGKWIWGK